MLTPQPGTKLLLPRTSRPLSSSASRAAEALEASKHCSQARSIKLPASSACSCPLKSICTYILLLTFPGSSPLSQISCHLWLYCVFETGWSAGYRGGSAMAGLVCRLRLCVDLRCGKQAYGARHLPQIICCGVLATAGPCYQALHYPNAMMVPTHVTLQCDGQYTRNAAKFFMKDASDTSYVAASQANRHRSGPRSKSPAASPRQSARAFHTRPSMPSSQP